MQKDSLPLSTGAWTGGLTGILLVTLTYLGNQWLRLPFVPFDLWNWQARVVPGNLLALAVSGIGWNLAKLFGADQSQWGKTSEQVGALILVIGVLALAGLITAWLVRHTRRSGRWWGSIIGGVLLLLFGAVELTIGLRNPVFDLLWLMLLFVGWGLATGAVLDGILFGALTSETDEARRQGLVRLAQSIGGVALASWAVGRIAGIQRRETGADQPLAEVTAVPPAEPLGETSETSTPPVVEATRTPRPPSAEKPDSPVGEDGRIVPVPGTRAEITPRGEFYRVDINAAPLSIDGTLWRLVIAGLFEETPRLTMSDLRNYPIHTQPITLSCISNPIGGSAISAAYWTGLRLKDLVEDLGLKPEANYLYIQSADGFYETVVMEDIMNPRTLLVYGMNDRSLPEKHGYPLRIYIPNRYGMKQPKWIERMEAVAEDQGGYWTDRDWSKQAIAKTTSVIDVVAVDEARNGFIPVGGVAWAGARGIQKVEVQVDGGPWVEAALRTPPLGPLTWMQWRYEWPASEGDHTFTVRATDGEGELQTSERSGTLPDGATGYHTLEASI